MSRNVMYALFLIALTVIVLVINREGVSVDLIVTKIPTRESFAYLGFTAVGVVIGVLLK